eukprot:CAMPEP_0119413540 /NCGR_PEP_ID=MMETSP1335-20130426/5588_1 /TAXON_ID=259385 /ORGANISM="Chrysoculter rhomboideus, Strain RCC1486" /LENGTH=329 /DNA_ID=CAMNT_0007438341 /DNA_START=65 /DNA_END=1054 /DNA_ORIENTATION=+
MVESSINVVVTGAAGQISYSLLPRLLDGTIFGAHVKINLRLLEVAPALEAVHGVVLELEDLRAPLLGKTLVTSNPEEAFVDADVAILVGAFPRKDGMERKDLLAKNGGIFTEQGKALAKVGNPNCKIVVVGNPANTNARILADNAAPTIPRGNITALTRLDHNRLHSQLAMRVGASVDDVKQAVIWGNHSATQFPDWTHATVKGVPVAELLKSEEDQAWLKGDLISCVQKRGAAVIKARKLSSAMSAARAIYDHLHDLYKGNDDWVSMAVPSDGSYGIPKDLVYSFPCKCKGGGEYEIIQGVEVNAWAQEKMTITKDELLQELATATGA